MLVITTMKGTREKIIKSALKLFSQKGFLGTTTKEIAKEAGVAEVTLFRYFQSKENLFNEVLKSQSFLPTLRDLLPKLESADYREALETIGKYFLKLLKKKRDLVCIMHSEAFMYPEEIRQIYGKIIDELTDTLSEFLNRLKRREVIRDIDTKYASMIFFGMIYNMFIKREIVGKKINQKKSLNSCIDIFYHGTRRS